MFNHSTATQSVAVQTSVPFSSLLLHWTSGLSRLSSYRSVSHARTVHTASKRRMKYKFADYMNFYFGVVIAEYSGRITAKHSLPRPWNRPHWKETIAFPNQRRASNHAGCSRIIIRTTQHRGLKSYNSSLILQSFSSSPYQSSVAVIFNLLVVMSPTI